MNKHPLFRILDNGDGTGSGIDKANPDSTLGSAIDCTIASPAFINDSGVLVFPQLSADGRIPVTTDAAGECHYAHAKVTGSTSFQDLGNFVGALNKQYDKIGVSVASSTEACWEVVYVDDVGVSDTEEILACFNTGPGQYSYCCELSCVDVDTSAGTLVQNIKIRGKLLDATGSELCGTIWLHELTE